MDTHFSLDTFQDSVGRLVKKPEDALVDWRMSLYAAITSPDHPGCVLMVRANDAANAWQFPGGGVEVHEGLIGGLLREIQEETGYDSVQLSTEYVAVDERAFSHTSQNRFFHAVLMIFRGELSAGTPEKLRTGDPVNPDEIQEMRWMPLTELDPASVHLIHRAYVEKLKRVKLKT